VHRSVDYNTTRLFTGKRRNEKTLTHTSMGNLRALAVSLVSAVGCWHIEHRKHILRCNGQGTVYNFRRKCREVNDSRSRKSKLFCISNHTRRRSFYEHKLRPHVPHIKAVRIPGGVAPNQRLRDLDCSS
jgi:hypothetical protein